MAGAAGDRLGLLVHESVQPGVQQLVDRTFTVNSDSPRFARDVLDPPMMAFLLSHPDAGFKIKGAQVIRVTRGRG